MINIIRPGKTSDYTEVFSFGSFIKKVIKKCMNKK